MGYISKACTIKYVILHRAEFHTSKIIDPCNVYLEDDCVLKAIGMGSIIMEAIVKGKINCVVVKDVLHMPELQTDFLPVGKFVLNKFENKIHP